MPPFLSFLVCIRVSKGRDVSLSLCPRTKKFPCPAVLLSRDKRSSKNPGTNSSARDVLGQNHYLVVKKMSKPHTGPSHGTEDFVPGQRGSGTRKVFRPGTKEHWDVLSLGNPSLNGDLLRFTYLYRHQCQQHLQHN